MSQLNETVRLVLGYAFAFFVFGGSMWLLRDLLGQLQDPNLAAIPESLISFVIGGILTLATGAASFVFGQAIMSAAARSASTATAAGTKAALTQPPNSSPTMTATNADSVTVAPAEVVPE